MEGKRIGFTMHYHPQLNNWGLVERLNVNRESLLIGNLTPSSGDLKLHEDIEVEFFEIRVFGTTANPKSNEQYTSRLISMEDFRTIRSALIDLFSSEASQNQEKVISQLLAIRADLDIDFDIHNCMKYIFGEDGIRSFKEADKIAIKRGGIVDPINYLRHCILQETFSQVDITLLEVRGKIDFSRTREILKENTEIFFGKPDWYIQEYIRITTDIDSLHSLILLQNLHNKEGLLEFHHSLAELKDIINTFFDYRQRDQLSIDDLNSLWQRYRIAIKVIWSSGLNFSKAMKSLLDIGNKDYEGIYDLETIQYMKKFPVNDDTKKDLLIKTLGYFILSSGTEESFKLAAEALLRN